VYPEGEFENPRGPLGGQRRVCRGGFWNSNALTCSNANRNNLQPDYNLQIIGLRVCRNSP